MNRRYPLPSTLALVSVALGGCPTSPAYIECEDDTSCGLAPCELRALSVSV
jgi:hypothetical protein